MTAVTHEGDDASAVTGVLLADGSRIGADAVVLANAVGARDIAGLGFEPAVRPVYGDVLRLDAPASLRGLIGGTIRALVAGRPAYLVPRADGTLVLGATSREDGNPSVSVGGVHELLRDAIRLLPALAEFTLLESVARARPGTPDNAPLLGRLPALGLIAATGTFRNGVLLAPIIADTVAHLVGTADRPVGCDLAAFAPDRFAQADPDLAAAAAPADATAAPAADSGAATATATTTKEPV